jgi:predicted  nucleic acid-binding Zn-ribbon protein
MANIQDFVTLSAIDDRRLALERKLANAPRGAREGEARAAEAKQALQRFKEDAKKAGLELKRLEAEAKAKQQEVEKTQVAQNQAKGNEEFKLLGKKIDGLKEEIGSIEMKILEEYERQDHRGADQAALEAKEKEAAKEAAGLTKEAEGQIAALRSELAQVETERKAATAGLDKGSLEMYRQALDRHGDKAVAAVSGGVCQGCFISIRPNQVSLLKSKEQIVSCWQCGRILFLEGTT